MQNSAAAISSVDRALQLLVILREGPIGVAEAADRLGVSRPTASRLLATMGRHEFAAQGPDRRYRAGAQLIGDRAATQSLEDLRAALRPSLIAMQAQLNETLNLWVLEGVFVRNIDGIETNELLSIRANAWERVPAYCSAAGKAMLATYTNLEVERMHANGLPPWRSTRTNGLTGLKRHLQAVRRQGYATNLEEASQGVFGVGAAVVSATGAALAAVGCGVPAARYSRERAAEIADVITNGVQEMSQILQQAGATRTSINAAEGTGRATAASSRTGPQPTHEPGGDRG